MNNTEVKAFIAEKVAEGNNLSKVQDLLLSEKGVKITYMELRLLASELESANWSQFDKKEEPKKETPAAGDAPNDEELPDGDEDAEELPAENTQEITGKTVVELSKLMKPGAIANGSVQFGSGAKADWYLDQMGRIGLSNAKGKPTETDIQEFQLELQKLLGA